MSLHIAAKHLAAQGRGPDTTLVHMAPREVAGLQAIAKAHGGSLTINPETGLAEAGFLSRILPTLAGAALAATGVGAPMAALMIGGGTALAKGDLKAGLMAGLGAYGGAGLTSGAATLGAEQAGTAAGQEAGLKAGAESLGTTPEVMATQQGSQQALTTSYPDMSGNITPDTSFIDPTKAQQYSNAYSEAYKPAFDANNVKNFDNTMSGFKAAGNDFGAYAKASGGYGGLAQSGLAAMAPAMADKQPVVPGVEHYNGPLSRYSMSENYKPYEAQQPNPYYQAQYQTYAGGGTVEQMSNANAVGQNTGYPQADIQGHAYATPWQTPVSENMVTDTADTGVNRMTGEMNFAAGGHLGGYSDGGRMLKGPGDGMSDSIPAKIGAKQPARLADGEFVVPADVVSHLGNGSSDAGAKQLYKMMDRIRAARTGKKKQAPQVNPGKAMPA
jgi:hypothetical protein